MLGEQLGYRRVVASSGGVPVDVVRRRIPSEAKPVDLERSDGKDDQPRPGWPAHHEDGELWTLYQPLNQRWEEWEGEVEYEGKKCSMSHGEMVDDGIIKRGATVEATTPLGQRPMRIMETLHSPIHTTSFRIPKKTTKQGDQPEGGQLARFRFGFVDAMR